MILTYDMHQYEDVIELNIPVDVDQFSNLNYNWVPYNPRKTINRWGCSITSIDGNDSGVPDLDSLREYNEINNTNLSETDFNTPTKHSYPFNYFLNKFSVGRSHYIKLDAGGFFPWHRDYDQTTYRIIYTIENCNPEKFIWLEDDKILNLKNNSWYYINTKKKHAVFAFDEVKFTVFNVLSTRKNLETLKSHLKIL